MQFTLTGIMLGLGPGQLVLGPISDAVFRLRKKLGGIAAHAVMSVLAGLAPSIEMLTAVRIGQGISGAAVAVTAMAVVRDLFTGRRAAGLLSHLTLVIGVAPILAPSLGGLLLQLTGWRGIFGALAGIAYLSVIGTVFGFVAFYEGVRLIGAARASSLKASVSSSPNAAASWLPRTPVAPSSASSATTSSGCGP